MPETIIGLEIGTNLIKAVEIKKTVSKTDSHGITNPEFFLKKLAVIKTPKNAIIDGIIKSPDEIAKAINEMFLQNGIRSTKVAIAIEGKQVLTQMIKLPLMPNEEMKEVVKGEASHYAVFAGKRVIVGLQSLEKIIEAGVQRVNVLWAAVEYEAVNILKKMLEEILIVSSFSKARHLKLVAVDILPLAILRCLKPKQAELPENAGTIVVCIGERTTYVTITKGKSVMIGRNGGTICSIQNIDIGSNSIIEITGANDITSVKNVPQRLTELINEIQKSFGYSKSLKLDWDGKIILSADISALINFDKFLSKQLGVEVEVYNPLNFITYNKEDFSAEYLNRMSTSLTSVIGLAMSNCKEKNSVNLLPEKQLKDLLKSHILPIFWGVASLMLALVISANVYFAKKIDIAKSELNKLTVEIKKIDNALFPLAEYEGKITGVEEKYKTEELIKTKSVMVSWSKNLDELKLRIPKDVWLNELTVAEGKLITFNGTAVFADSIIEFIKSLNTSVCFKDFSLQSTAIVKTKDKWLIKFVLTGYSRN